MVGIVTVTLDTGAIEMVGDAAATDLLRRIELGVGFVVDRSKVEACKEVQSSALCRRKEQS